MNDMPRRDWRKTLHGHARSVGLEPQVDSFWFLRHGESKRNAARIIQGQTCDGLSEKGHGQAAAAAERIPTGDLTLIALSELQRVRETAMPVVARAPQAAVVWEPGLRERGFGAYEGDGLNADLWFSEDRGSEPMRAFAARVLAAADRRLRQDGVLLVAHGGVLHVIAAALHVRTELWSRDNAIPIHFSRTPHGWLGMAMTEDGPIPVDDPSRQPVGDVW